MNQRDGNNYYDILEVPATAPQSEIHKAYQRAKATYSQDNPALYSMFSRDEARELLKMIEEAFAVLGNQSLRRSYDESLARGETFDISDPSTTAPATKASAPPAATHMPNPAQVASAHEALPDFAGPEPTLSDARVRKDSNGGNGNKTPLPAGMGRTALSTYKLDDTFEAELGATSSFDGELLQKTRVYKNISIDKMSEATRISRTYLTAVETNDFKSLPAAVFVRGFVIQISRVLGLDENKVAASYMKTFKGATSGR